MPRHKGRRRAAPKSKPPRTINRYWILLARGELGWTQKQLGESLGVPASTVCRWEKGRWAKLTPYLRCAIELFLLKKEVPADRRQAIETAATALMGQEPGEQLKDWQIDELLDVEDEQGDMR